MHIVVQCFLNEHSSELSTTKHSQSKLISVPVFFHVAKIRFFTRKGLLTIEKLLTSIEGVALFSPKNRTFAKNNRAQVLHIHDKSFEIFIRSEEILAEIDALATAINTDYAG
ncbi:MAG: hypothetical protein V4685_14965, partial [Bacteroidota bacterium]